MCRGPRRSTRTHTLFPYSTLCRAVQALKGAKELVGMCHVETRSVVADEIGVLPLVAAAAELDAGRRAPGGELPGVAQQVLQSDLQQLGISPYDHGRLDHEVRHPVRPVPLQVLGDEHCHGPAMT